MGIEDVNAQYFFSLSEFLFSACIFVTIANAGPVLIRLAGIITSAVFKAIGCAKCKTKKKKKSKSKSKKSSSAVAPVRDPTKVTTGKEEARKAESTGKGNADAEEEATFDAEKAEIEETVSDSVKAGVESLIDQGDDTVDSLKNILTGQEETDDDPEEYEEYEEESERSKVNNMWMNVLHAALTLYVVWSYLVANVPKGASMTCRAAHMIVVPLFKPVAMSMWPALMPLVQFAYWQDERKGDHPEEYAKKAVLPGRRPFDFHWLSFMYASFVGVGFFLYLLATILVWPLLIVYSYIILFSIVGIVFAFLHVPREFLLGRAMFCCRCRAKWFEKDDLIYMSDGELKRMAQKLGEEYKHAR